MAYGNLGSAYQSLGDFKTAIEYHQQALSIFKDAGNKDLQGHVMRTLVKLTALLVISSQLSSSISKLLVPFKKLKTKTQKERHILVSLKKVDTKSYKDTYM